MRTPARRILVVSILALGMGVLSPAAGADSHAAEAANEPAPLVRPLWRWDRTLMDDGSVHAPEDADSNRYTVQFQADGKVSIRADCNRARGSYVLEGSSIAIQSGPTTLMACPEGSLASVFLKDLGGAAIYFLRDGNLYLDLRYDSGTMSLSPRSRELVGTRWRATGYNNGKQAVVSPIAGSDLTLSFQPEGRVTGSAGCNTYGATWEANGETIRIGPPASTRKLCAEPEGVMEQEARYLTALQMGARRVFDGDRLELRTADGVLAASFLPAKE